MESRTGWNDSAPDNWRSVPARICRHGASAAAGLPAIGRAVVIDVVTVQPVVIVEAVIVIEAATVSPPEAAMRGMVAEAFGSGMVAKAGTAAVDAGTSAVDADTPAVDMIGHAAGVFTTEA